MTEAAVLLCGHGSRDCEAIDEFELVAAALRPSLPEFDVGTGYLEFARPTIRDGLAALAASIKQAAAFETAAAAMKLSPPDIAALKTGLVEGLVRLLPPPAKPAAEPAEGKEKKKK